MRLGSFGSNRTPKPPKGRAGKSQGDFTTLKQRVEEAREYKRQNVHRDWETYRRYYSSDGQRDMIRAGIKDEELKKCAVVSNFIFSSTEAYLAFLLDSLPDWFVVGGNGDLEGAAGRATDYLQAWYEAQHVVAQYEVAGRDAITLGTGVVKAYWDNLAQEVRVRAADPFQIFPDPTGQNATLEDTSFISSRNVYSEDFAARMWPKADLSKAQTASTGDEDDPTRPRQESAIRQVEIWEVFHDFGAAMTVYSGDLVLYEGANPTPNGKYPFFFFRMHPLTGQFWGRSAIAWVTDLQDEINRVRTRIAIHHRYTAPPVLVTDDPDAQVDLTAGRVLRVKPGMTAKFLEPPSLPSDILNMLMKCQSDFDTIFGVQDVTRGLRPKGATSGIMVEALQQGAQMRMGGPMRAWSHTHREVGQTTLEIMQASYASDRSIALMGQTVGRNVTLSPDDLSMPRPQLYGEMPAPLNAEPEPPPTDPHDLRVVCSTKADIPLSQAAQAELAIRLAQLGAVDQEGLLEATHFPGRAAVMQRAAALKGEQQAGMMAALEAQAQDELALSAAAEQGGQVLPAPVDQTGQAAMLQPTGQ